MLGPPPGFLIHQFVPGDPALGLDGLDAEPNGMTHFRGLAAMGYTEGVAVDKTGRQYRATTDNRVYQGEYVGADGTHAWPA